MTNAHYLYTPGCCCGSPAPDPHGYVAAWNDSTLHLLDADDGSTLWTWSLSALDTPTWWMPRHLVFDDERNLYGWAGAQYGPLVATASYHAWLFKLDPNGTLLWSIDLGETASAAFTGNNGAGLYGGIRWAFDTLWVSPTCLASDFAFLLRFDPDGGELHRYSHANVQTGAGIFAPPLSVFLSDFAVDAGGDGVGRLWFSSAVSNNVIGLESDISRRTLDGTFGWWTHSGSINPVAPTFMPKGWAFALDELVDQKLYVGTNAAGTPATLFCGVPSYAAHPDLVHAWSGTHGTPSYINGFDLCDMQTGAGQSIFGLGVSIVRTWDIDAYGGRLAIAHSLVPFLKGNCFVSMGNSSGTGDWTQVPRRATSAVIGIGNRAQIRFVRGSGQPVIYASNGNSPTGTHQVAALDVGNGATIWSALPVLGTNPSNRIACGLATFYG